MTPYRDSGRPPLPPEKPYRPPWWFYVVIIGGSALLALMKYLQMKALAGQ